MKAHHLTYQDRLNRRIPRSAHIHGNLILVRDQLVRWRGVSPMRIDISQEMVNQARSIPGLIHGVLVVGSKPKRKSAVPHFSIQDSGEIIQRGRFAQDGAHPGFVEQYKCNKAALVVEIATLPEGNKDHMYRLEVLRALQELLFWVKAKGWRDRPATPLLMDDIARRHCIGTYKSLQGALSASKEAGGPLPVDPEAKPAEAKPAPEKVKAESKPEVKERKKPGPKPKGKAGASKKAGRKPRKRSSASSS